MSDRKKKQIVDRFGDGQHRSDGKTSRERSGKSSSRSSSKAGYDRAPSWGEGLYVPEAYVDSAPMPPPRSVTPPRRPVPTVRPDDQVTSRRRSLTSAHRMPSLGDDSPSSPKQPKASSQKPNAASLKSREVEEASNRLPSPIFDSPPSRSTTKSESRTEKPRISKSSSIRSTSSTPTERVGLDDKPTLRRRSSSSTPIRSRSKSSSTRSKSRSPEAHGGSDRKPRQRRSIGRISSMELREMAHIATATKQKLDNEECVDKKPRGVGWNANLYMVSNDDESPAPRSRSPQHHEENFVPYGHQSMDIDYSDAKPAPRELRRSSSTGPTSFGPNRKNTLIVDKKKRDTRWQWNQARVSRTFKPYRVMLSEQDDLLPDSDDFKAFEASENAADKEFSNVRDAMLEDTDLNEREVAAFFEGFALFNVKIRSLQSQLDSLKAVNRAYKSQGTVKSRSKSSSRSESSRISQASSHDTPTIEEEATSSDEGPRILEASPRAISIKKEKKQHNANEEVQRLIAELEEADKKQKKLQKQLQQAGINIAEDIPYAEAKMQVGRIAKRMGEIGSSEVIHPDKAEQARLREEYFKLEQEMEKYNTALTLTDEYIEEQEELEQKWQDDHEDENLEALKRLRRHMPVEVKSMSEAQLSSQPSPNGKVLPSDIAKKFKRTNVLQIIRTNPEDLMKVHPSTLENLRVTGLTLTERRAIYAHIKDIGPRWKAMQADKMTERKWTWFKMMKQNFKENLSQYEHHIEQYGPPGNHPYATRENPKAGCPFIGKQCPLKADKIIDYNDDYGYSDGAVYEVSNVRKSDKEDPGAKAKREAIEMARDKKANERSVELRKHYKGKLLPVSLANGSCESMDEILDNIDALQSKWIEERIVNEGEELSDAGKARELSAFTDALNELKLAVLPLAERSGMQLTGKKDANAAQEDRRSAIELGLCEEVYEACTDFFDGINERTKEIKAKDSRLKSTIEHLHELLDELHEKNLATLKDLKCKLPAPSRKRKSRADLTREAKAKARALGSGKEDVGTEDGHGPRPAATMGGRGSLMSAIAGRGRGGGGRGDLLGAIAGRGRGPAGGHADLLRAIAGRGRGPAGGRGDFLGAIAGRGRGPAGGRGDLLSAIAGRGRGPAGERGDLMSAIAGRGREKADGT